jgi:fucokinase
MKQLSFKREGRTTITKDIILTTAHVRIDLGGGWSDTPSICYEQGGSVLNVAVQVDNQRPVRCLSRAIHGCFQIKLHALKRSDNQSVSGDSVNCTKFKDFLSVSDTSLSTSLLKAVIVVLEIIDKSQIENCRNIDDDLDTKMFSKSLEEKFNGGIEICCISDLPSGSGMGGSSVLAAVIIRSISDLLDLGVTNESLVYLVTQVEQVLSSGGGYQGIIITIVIIIIIIIIITIKIKLDQYILVLKFVAVLQNFR